MYKQKGNPKKTSVHASTIYNYDAEHTASSFYEWWEGIRHYYGIDTYELQNTDNSVSSWTIFEQSQGFLEFDAKYIINLCEQWIYDENRNRHWCMGMLIEDMIQF